MLERTPQYFELFNEIGIINQLSRAAFEARLPPGVLAPHFSVLNHLVRISDGRTPLEIARAFQVPKTTMTHTLSGLQARGWVEMRPNPKDGRSKRIWLTDAGRSFRQEAIDDAAPAIGRALADVSPNEIEAALPFLRKVRIALDTARDEP